MGMLNRIVYLWQVGIGVTVLAVVTLGLWDTFTKERPAWKERQRDRRG